MIQNKDVSFYKYQRGDEENRELLFSKMEYRKGFCEDEAVVIRKSETNEYDENKEYISDNTVHNCAMTGGIWKSDKQNKCDIRTYKSTLQEILQMEVINWESDIILEICLIQSRWLSKLQEYSWTHKYPLWMSQRIEKTGGYIDLSNNTYLWAITWCCIAIVLEIYIVKNISSLSSYVLYSWNILDITKESIHLLTSLGFFLLAWFLLLAPESITTHGALGIMAFLLGMKAVASLIIDGHNKLNYHSKKK